MYEGLLGGCMGLLEGQRREKVLATFRQEAAERLARVDEQLLALEQGADDVGEALRSIFRDVHSLKGAAGLLVLGPVVDVLHTLETVMERLRNGALAADPAVVSVLLESTDALRNLLSNLESPRPELAAALTNMLERLTLKEPAAVETLASAPPMVAAPADANSLRLAVCDDALFSRKLIVDIAREAGWSVVWQARDGKEAVEMFLSDPPDLLTLDLTMPVMTGMDALREIRKSHPDAPVVIISAIDQRSVVAECLRAGASDFMTKPVDRSRILALLHRFQRIRQS